MLLSMTGYGRAKQTIGEQSILVEVKSLNSKYFDLKLRLPQGFSEKEILLRQLMTTHIKRGKVDATIEVRTEGTAQKAKINIELFEAYYHEISRIQAKLGISSGDIVQSIMRIPDVSSPGEDAIDEATWQHVKTVLNEAMQALVKFRESEGEVTETDFRLRVKNIRTLLAELTPHEAPRVEKLRQRFSTNLDELHLKNGFDENRFEQEILFYIEKLDLTEEKVRLEQHCDYFIQQLDDTKTMTKGKKLNFISQEMGREINTLGSKANSADIQRIVVQMKDELEKIKEQTSNIL